MRPLLLALLLVAACAHPDDAPSSEGTENPDVTTTVELPPEAAASADTLRPPEP